MCGIVGIIKQNSDLSVANEVLAGLVNLEYRGYDSTGVAILNSDKLIDVEKKCDAPSAMGKEELFKHSSSVAIGHNRWATHGKATIQNAHPHVTKKVALVHNGTIDNFSELKTALKNKKYQFFGESDTEVISVLMTSHLDEGMSGEQAFVKTLSEIKGAFALGVIVANEQNKLYFAKQNSPLLIGKNDTGFCVASDVVAFPLWVNYLIILEDGDYGFIEDFVDDNEKSVIGEYKTFMLKEIAEQATVNGGIINHYIDIKTNNIELGVDINWKEIESVHIVACGTSYYAGTVAGYYFEKYAKIPVYTYIASEFPYRDRETLDTINAIQKAQELGYKTLGVVNAKHTTITRLIKNIVYCRAGTEVSVASTKAFTAQLTVLLTILLKISIDKGLISRDDYKNIIDEMFTIGGLTANALKTADSVEKIANSILDIKGLIYLGRGMCYGLALEGALKMKELSYIHAEGLNCGEMKHGPIALIDGNEAVVIITHFRDPLLNKTRSTVQEVAARKGRIILIADKKAIEEIKSDIDDTIVFYSIEIPESSFFTYPLLAVIPLQFLAHFVATGLGRNVDKPRNLAKSVTVE
ncbi:unnamed protein product [Rotaria magnacalcarata]|uniref:glutamine--fructose-6-phosphate transaminase (isomerizing) n=1 Tax=Rotaria magnacalcarata TaxID=392030 RepID=A0A8S2J615_9BILA|nr:unnamed protein product [Rotaria magnacalcarata]